MSLAEKIEEQPVQKKKVNWKGIVVVVLLLAVITAAGVVATYLYDNTVYKHCVAEAGTEVLPEDFAINQNVELVFASDSPKFFTTIPDDYPVILQYGPIKFNSVLTIQDTIAPTAQVSDLTIEAGQTVTADDFLSDVSDITATVAVFAGNPDFSHYGIQDVKIRLVDLGNNESVYEAKLTISPLIESITMEAGDPCPDEKDFLISKDVESVHIVSDLAMIDTARTGEYNITFSDLGRLFYSKLIIQDTVSPTLELHDVDAYMTSPIDTESFVTEADDVSAFSLRFKDEPDMTKEGEQEITVIATDTSGNETKKSAKLSLKRDTESPVITGVKDIFAVLGESISYRKGIQVTDNCDENVKLDINTGGANNKEEGQYTITYTATDKAGNSVTQTALLTVKHESYDQATVDAMADAVLAKILTPDMDGRAKLDAIYKWVRSTMSYANHSDKTNWLKGAYEGLKYHRGDCYIYFAQTKALLNRAGIANMDIQKLPGYRTMHYWNLVDIGEGWHHYDTCPRVGGGTWNYLTDAELMSYSESHNNSHIYDRSLYPVIP